MTVKIHVHAKLPDDTGGCPFCDQAKTWLSLRGISHTTDYLGPQARQLLYDRLELQGKDRTVPQVMITDDEGETHRIGGFQELQHSGVESLFR